MDGALIRTTLLSMVKEYAESDRSTLQSAELLNAVALELKIKNAAHLEDQRALLTCWGDLFRSGFLCWGHDMDNAAPPFFHLTELSRRALEHLDRDPMNPDGYLGSLVGVLEDGSVAESYVSEAVWAFHQGLLKAAMVMVGAASESLILDVRSAAVDRLEEVGADVNHQLKDWRVKTVRDALATFFEERKADMPRHLRERTESFWTAQTEQIRYGRNEVGHPRGVEPVSHETVHASLLLFPDLADLVKSLIAWIQTLQL